MATVRPLSALRYAPERVDLGLVLAPPALASEEERRALHAREPRNAVHVVEDGALDGASSKTVARRAALYLAEWRRAGVLAPDEHPALYLVRQIPADDEGQASVGFFAALRLDAQAARDVRGLPVAEELDPAVVDAQRTHLDTTGVQTGAVLFSYGDEGGRIERVLSAELEEREPDLRGRAFGAAYEMWIVDDETTTARVTRHLEEQELTLVAGHERFQAASLLEQERSEQRPLGGADDVACALGFFVKVGAGELDERALTLPPRGLVLAPLVASGADDG